jgi:two-component system LytT family response regulator
MMFRTLLVDDEQPALDRLRRLLAEIPGIDVVGEAHDGEDAMDQIAALKPDLIFLDIQLPGCTGMEVAASIGAPSPRIVFCTAFDKYAVEAFELNAVDYLLKPVNRDRLLKAVERLRASAATATPTGDLASRTGGAPVRFLARRGSAFRVVPVSDVLGFVSEDGLTKLVTAGQHSWMQPTLNELDARLDPRQFCRISRAAIVNLDAVREVTPQDGGQGIVTLADGTKLEVSRRRFAELTNRLAGST